jgi:zinc transport system substrate-binding protein
LSFLVICLFIFSGCSINLKDISDQGKIKVVTTIFPLYEFVKEVGGSNIDVSLLLPPNSDIHTYDLKPSDIIKINKADVFVFIGAGMEPWAHKVVEGIDNKNLIIFEASKVVNLLKHDNEEHDHDDEKHENGDETHEDYDEMHENDDEAHEYDDEVHEDDDEMHEHSHGQYDPHIWLDFDNNKEIVLAISKILSEKDNANKDYYIENANRYITELEELNQEYLISLSNCKHNTIISGGHNSFSYLANKYAINMITAYGLSPDSEPTSKRIKEIIDLTNENKVKIIFFERFVNPKMAETIAKDTNTNTLVLNPGQNLYKEQFESGVTFIDIMKDNLNNLVIGLECEIND